ncbi:MAG: alpha-glucosidase [Spirochaetia bacterium]|nr:alpha-glucosidase [Spirochaetia bacterium]
MELKWWQKAIFYQVFLRSFKDSNNDGIGDIKGLISKINYLIDLGIDAIYITPFFPSPYYDSGFDVTDFYDVDSKVGTKNDLIKLIESLHMNNLKLVIDIPINHTSIFHQWFQNSCLSKDNEFSDFYLWSDTIPNNWVSNFGGSSWTYNQTRNQYYMHSFSKDIPDLNWRCEALVCKMLDVFKYYLDLGVDGLRLSTTNLIIKDHHFRNNPKYPGTFKNKYLKQRHIFDRNRPYSHKIIKRIRSLIDSYDDKVLIGDIVVAPPGEPELVASYYGVYKDELNLAFDYSIANTPIRPNTFRIAAKRWIEACDTSWPSWIFSSHDHKRLMTRMKKNIKKTRLVTMFLLTQKGTPFLYYGEELGLEDSMIPKKEQKDLQRKQLFFFQNSRDGARGPMLWDNSPYSGFSTVKPYLPQGNAKKCVEIQKNKEVSMFKYYKKFIALRKTHAALIEGDISFLDINDGNIISYIRTCDDESLLILLNFSKKKRVIKLSDVGLPFITKNSIFSTNPLAKCPDYNSFGIILHAYEGAIYSIDL